ncbi:class II aldolase and Adducin N-terminal domain-domain-containing protein [Clohesyomyces aquaticus]|uniref:Class II aldolase and Adducin N-terminal domain-domain-containing protein n=1 Tax=Clohesyomyces aquaticus TaxID=1231657 RepID=A0A1Y1ZLF4_9PLEO|nr:class II aldolase and Adducin N-terminal domain-domain-containing protein [Clohesyomyces aquaticus]
MSAGYFPKREKVGLEDLFKGLVTASHILHHNGIVDAYGHISVRSPDNPATFWMPCNIPPALISTPDDLIEYNVEDATPVEKNVKPGYLERCIHSEIYKRFPAVNSVVHSHSSDVLPYCISGVPLKPTIHLAGFLGSSVPVWDISSHYPSGSKHDLLVRDTTLGASLSASFKPATSAGFLYSKMRSALPSQIGGTAEPDHEPEHAVVLMQSHGFTTAAHGIEEAVFQAIYTKEAAKAQTTALAIRNAHFGRTVEGNVDVEHGGKIKSAKVKAEGDLKYLTDRQARDTSEAMQATISRPWGLWCREVEINPLYKNECPSGED